MAKRNSYGLEERQRRCMLRLVQDILSDKSVEQISFENAHGAISVRRAVPEKRSIYAIGFNANFEEYEESEEE